MVNNYGEYMKIRHVLCRAFKNEDGYIIKGYVSITLVDDSHYVEVIHIDANISRLSIYQLENEVVISRKCDLPKINHWLTPGTKDLINRYEWIEL
jgi:hypothetical protein